MNVKEALDHVIGVAAMWGENQEEGFSRRVNASDTDEDCKDNAEGTDWEFDDVKQVRDLWLAIDVLHEWQVKAGQAIREAKQDPKI